MGVLTKGNPNFDILSLCNINHISRISLSTTRVVLVRKASPVRILIVNQRDWVFSVEVVSLPCFGDIGAGGFVVAWLGCVAYCSWRNWCEEVTAESGVEMGPCFWGGP